MGIFLLFLSAACVPIIGQAANQPSPIIIKTPSLSSPNKRATWTDEPEATPVARQTLIAAWTSSPTPTIAPFFIPTSNPKSTGHTIATISTSEVAHLSTQEIIILLFEKYFEERKSDQTPFWARIKDGEVKDIEYKEPGRFIACMVMTPTDPNSVLDTQGSDLPDGRIRVCSLFDITLDKNIYQLTRIILGP